METEAGMKFLFRLSFCPFHLFPFLLFLMIIDHVLHSLFPMIKLLQGCYNKEIFTVIVIKLSCKCKAVCVAGVGDRGESRCVGQHVIPSGLSLLY